MADDGRQRHPTRFGHHLLELMADAGFSRQLDLVAASGVSASTVSRLIYSGEYRPDMRTFERLGDALGVAATDLFAAHAGEVHPPVVGDLPPLAAELAGMLHPDSPLADEDRLMLQTVIDRLIDPHRRVMRRRSSG